MKRSNGCDQAHAGFDTLSSTIEEFSIPDDYITVNDRSDGIRYRRDIPLDIPRPHGICKFFLLIELLM